MTGRGAMRRLRAATGGTAAVEFALVAPLLIVLFAGITDLGGALLTRFRLDAAASGAAGYAMVKAKSVTAADGGALAAAIAALARSDAGVAAGTSVATDVTVVVNNGPTATVAGAGSVVVTNGSGAAAQPADLCYCPGANPFAWGAAVACGGTCAGGGTAGKFVAITLKRPYVALFSRYGFITGNTISASAIVQTR